MVLGQGEFGTVREVVEISDKGGHRELPKLLRRLSTQQSQGPSSHNRQASMDIAFMGNSSVGRHAHNRQGSAGIDEMYEHDDHYEVVDRGDESSEVSLEMEEIEKAHRARKVLKKRCWREGKARYAIKRLRDDLLDFVRDDDVDYDHQHRTIGAMDLAMEAKLLASFSHPNICKLRGTAGVPGRPDFSLILDRLYMTLEEKIDEWRGELKHSKRFANALSLKGFLKKLYIRKRPLDDAEVIAMDTTRSKTSSTQRSGQSNQMYQKEQLLHRLYAGFDVARALRHLHHHNLLYRDLKVRTNSGSVG
jgi:serine/threonine protein kinase